MMLDNSTTASAAWSQDAESSNTDDAGYSQKGKKGLSELKRYND